MKRYLLIRPILCLMSLLFTGCTKNAADKGESNSQTTSGQFAENNLENGKKKNKASIDGVDVDLTALSSTMVYAEVYNIILNYVDIYYCNKDRRHKNYCKYQKYHITTSVIIKNRSI